MNRRLRWLMVAVLLLVMFTFSTTLAPASVHAATAHKAQASVPNINLPCGPSTNNGRIVTKGGNRYRCECVRFEAGQPCQWVWRNLDATTFSYLEMDRQELITTGYKANFYFQPDGNLVDYDENGHARWASSTVGRGYQTVFQTDGNLVIYNSNNNPVWASNTAGVSGSTLSIQADGNIVIYNFLGFPLWSTRTYH